MSHRQTNIDRTSTHNEYVFVSIWWCMYFNNNICTY